MDHLGRKGIDSKFDRALAFAAEAERFASDYFASNPIELDAVDDNPLGQARVRVLHPLDQIALGMIVGDAAHNARTALDHLAWRLVEADGGTPGRGTQFPIVEGTAMGDALRNQLKGTSLPTRSAVRALGPHQGGDERFLTLNRLDIIDKHHTLLPTVFNATGLLLRTQSGRRNEDGEMIYFDETMDIVIPGAEPDPVVDGLLIQRPGGIDNDADADPDFPIGLRTSHSPVFEILVTVPTSGKRMKIHEITTLITDIRTLVEPLVARVA